MVKASAAERELVNKLEDMGHAVIRTPASGGSKKSPLPDLISGNRETTVAVECKSSKKGKIYIEGREIRDLITFGVRFWALPLIGARYDRKEWMFFYPHQLNITDGCNFYVEKESSYMRIEDVI